MFSNKGRAYGFLGIQTYTVSWFFLGGRGVRCPQRHPICKCSRKVSTSQGKPGTSHQRAILKRAGNCQEKEELLSEDPALTGPLERLGMENGILSFWGWCIAITPHKLLVWWERAPEGAWLHLQSGFLVKTPSLWHPQKGKRRLKFSFQHRKWAPADHPSLQDRARVWSSWPFQKGNNRPFSSQQHLCVPFLPLWLVGKLTLAGGGAQS